MSAIKNKQLFQLYSEKMKTMPIKKNSQFEAQNKNIFCHFTKKSLRIIIYSVLILVLFVIILKKRQNFLSHNHPNNNNNNLNSTSYKSINNTQEILEQKELDEFIIDGHHDVPVKILKFIKQCRDGILSHKENLVLSNNPKISVIIPFYNREHYITTAIRSCQNQKMKDIEIILIDDLSRDNSVKIVKELQKEDPRIRLITNDKRQGTLKNRYVGNFESKGKYITYLDSDDLFLREDLFDKIYKEAEEGDYDIVAFGAITSKNFNMNKNAIMNFECTHEQNITVIQPKLSDLLYKYNNSQIKKSFVDGVFWARLVKRNVMLKAFELVGPKMYNRFWSRTEDVVPSYALFKVAKNYRNLRFVGIYVLGGFKKYKNTEVRERRFYRRFKPYRYLNWVEGLLNMAQIYPNDKDILLYEFYNYQNYFKNCFYKELKEDSVRILKRILDLSGIDNKDRNEINETIDICMKTKN